MSRFKAVVIGLMLCSAKAGSAQAPVAGVTAVVGVDILPMTGRERLRDQTVLIERDRIAAVGPRARLGVPSTARRIDGRGLTLMPGLVDMHVHVPSPPGAPADVGHSAMAVMLAHGVTTARGMGGLPNQLMLREAIERGTVAGPRFYVAAPPLSARDTPSPDAARQAIIAAQLAGYDLIKLYEFGDVAIWQAVQDEARRAGFPVAGHLTNEVGLDRAMAAGQQIEHLDGIIFALLPKHRRERQDASGQTPPPAVIEGMTQVSDAALAALARRLAAAGSWHEPTLDFYARLVDVVTPFEKIWASPAMRYLPAARIAQWAAQHERLRRSGRTRAQIDAYVALRRRIVRALHRAGVPLLAGSDALNAFQVWGDGLINEIEALHAAGLSRMAALRSATVVPRDYFRSFANNGSQLGWRADFGIVAPGARADLILLRGDPSLSLRHLRGIHTVIAAGRVYDRAALDRMLDEAASAAQATRSGASLRREQAHE